MLPNPERDAEVYLLVNCRQVCPQIVLNVQSNSVITITVTVACSLEYENLENFYLEFFLTSKIWATVASKKNDGNLEINLEKVNLEKVVGNLI